MKTTHRNIKPASLRHQIISSGTSLFYKQEFESSQNKSSQEGAQQVSFKGDVHEFKVFPKSHC